MKNIQSLPYSTLNQKGFEVVSIDATNVMNYVPGITRVYKDVFNASAWKEGVKCSSGCGFKTTFEDAPQFCPNCSSGIEDFYSDLEIQESVEKVLSKTYFQCLLLIQEGDVAGFTWGWKDTLAGIDSEKLGLSESGDIDAPRMKNLIQNLQQNNINLSSGELYYQSETGISPQYRGKGLGTLLVAVNEEILRKNSDKVNAILQRTSRSSPMYTIRQNLGYNEVFSYDDEDKRVLFARNNY